VPDTVTPAWTTPPTPTASDADVAAVKATVFDYFEGWYDADPARMRRALHPGLAKRSWGQDRAQTPAVASVSAEQMVAWTAAGAGRRTGRADRSIDIRVAAASGGIATVVVLSDVYVEYLHLVATPDGWRIVNALWRYADGHGPTR
jgi:hypothetical protein